MIHNSEGKKLSKRDGATDVMAYKDMGYLPHALLNFLVRLGWSHGDDEIFSIDEMLKYFDPSDINRSASIYNTQKLDWLNAHYIKNLSNEELCGLMHFDVVDELLLENIKSRSKTLVELEMQIKEVLNAPLEYNQKDMQKVFDDNAKSVLNSFKIKLQNSNPSTSSEFHDLMQQIVEEMGIGFGKLGQPLRLALLGKLGGIALDVIMSVIGKDETLQRIDRILA